MLNLTLSDPHDANLVQKQERVGQFKTTMLASKLHVQRACCMYMQQVACVVFHIEGRDISKL